MSTDKNAHRVNLSFKASSDEQMKALEILTGVGNKTEYITQLILKSENIHMGPREMMREVFMEMLPQLLEKGYIVPAKYCVEKHKEEPDILTTEDNQESVPDISPSEFVKPITEFSSDKEKSQLPVNATVIENEEDDDEIIRSSGELNFEISDDFFKVMGDLGFGDEDDEPI